MASPIDLINQGTGAFRDYASGVFNAFTGNSGNSSNSSGQGSSSSSSSSSGGNQQLTASGVLKLAKDNNLTLDPDLQTALQQKSAQEDTNLQMKNQLQQIQQLAPIVNQGANLNAERTMAINAQQNAAANTANQLNNLTARAGQTANLLQGAYNTTASIFH